MIFTHREENWLEAYLVREVHCRSGGRGPSRRFRSLLGLFETGTPVMAPQKDD